MDVYDCAERYKRDNTSLILLAGKDYGSGSSRDWAAKGPFLLVSKFLNEGWVNWVAAVLPGDNNT